MRALNSRSLITIHVSQKEEGLTTRMHLPRSISLLHSHPGYAFSRIAEQSVPLPKRLLRKTVRGVTLEFDFSCRNKQERSILRSMFFGTYERPIVSMIQNSLAPGDIFLDVGANIGYLSSVALGIVGTCGEVHAFEPVPRYFERLQKIAKNNVGFRLFANCLAASDSEETVRIAASRDNIGWNTIVPGFMPTGDLEQYFQARTARLDLYVTQHLADRAISLIKIDTEGYEFPVLLGLEGVFASGRRPPIICEIAGGAYSYLGKSLSDLKNYMQSFGYRCNSIPYSIESPSLPVDLTTITSTVNVLFTNDSL